MMGTLSNGVSNRMIEWVIIVERQMINFSVISWREQATASDYAVSTFKLFLHSMDDNVHFESTHLVET
jgi:hypothetical protein